jgi:Calcineurin-like phosphoesterase
VTPPGRRTLTRREALLAGVVPLLAAVGGCDGPAAEGTAPRPPTATAAVPRGPVRSGLVAFGDSGGGPAQPAVARAMERWAATHRVDALVTTGDNVYERGEPELFAAQLDQPYRTLRRGRPLWATLGNHDASAGHGAEHSATWACPTSPTPSPCPGSSCCSWTPTGSTRPRRAGWTRLSDPAPDLRAVVFHHPAWSCSVHDTSEQVGRHWVPVLEDHRVALVLNGHDHNYQRFVSPGGVTYVVTGGGGRRLYPLDGCASGSPERVAGQVRHHFTAVEVRDGSLAVTAVAADGAVLDRTVIRR